MRASVVLDLVREFFEAQADYEAAKIEPRPGPLPDQWFVKLGVARSRYAKADVQLRATLAGHTPPRFDLVAHLHRQREFSERTFGPGARTEGVVDHIRKELAEVLEDRTIAEWVDVIILAFDGAWRSGAAPEHIVAAIVAKQTKNEARTWPDWRTMPEGKAIEHDRSADGVPKAEMATKTPVCVRCNDTHVIGLEDGQNISCTRCPVPCQKCRRGGRGAYCETTPCGCDCHGTMNETRVRDVLNTTVEGIAPNLAAKPRSGWCCTNCGEKFDMADAKAWRLNAGQLAHNCEGKGFFVAKFFESPKTGGATS